ncbi:Lrp/AsnC family transcriptional regulator [Fulvivirga kasyanovii]|uniref:Lrp/AsnC family transcriptional regulator n=1 Tax=Fulvivirga kasyanovii TaxID=396812 RepID=A0ABW9RNG4_9BACT|nr:Lrp/AsnC family transcriptional regulator [Fulvivirga kasyanovii]MTI25461.1 Lrp/AsnC family transcriptional regulator [Fulvivirga kasyanovii]
MDIKLDETDIKILEILQKEGRITTKALADRLKLSTTPVYERIKRLEREKIIDRYVALLNQKKLDIKLTVFIFISLKNHTRSYLESFIDEMNKFDEVTECYHVAGGFDFFLKVIIKDMEAYEAFLLTKLSVNTNIAHVQSSFVLSRSKHSTALRVRK